MDSGWGTQRIMDGILESKNVLWSYTLFLGRRNERMKLSDIIQEKDISKERAKEILKMFYTQCSSQIDKVGSNSVKIVYYILKGMIDRYWDKFYKKAKKGK